MEIKDNQRKHEPQSRRDFIAKPQNFAEREREAIGPARVLCALFEFHGFARQNFQQQFLKRNKNRGEQICIILHVSLYNQPSSRWASLDLYCSLHCATSDGADCFARYRKQIRFPYFSIFLVFKRRGKSKQRQI